MTYRKIFLTALCLMAVVGSWAAKVKKSAVPGERKVVAGMTIQATYLSDDIVHIVKYLGEGAAPQKKSYSVILTESTAQNPNVRVSIDGETGLVTFSDQKGEVLLSEAAAPMFEERSEGPDAGKWRVSQQWLLQNDEDIYGLGQLGDEAMTWRGRDMELWNHNGYIAIPYFTSSRGYGLYWDNAGKSRFKSETSPYTAAFTSEVAPRIDYYFIYRDGSQDGVIAGIRQLSGQATMFPLWTMGHWQCRERYKTSDELAFVLDKYRQLQIPLDGIVQDWQYWGCDSNWNAMRFQNPYYINKVGDPAWEKYLPDDLKKMAAEYKAKGLQPRLKSPEEMVKYVHQNNAHLMISIWASFGSAEDRRPAALRHVAAPEGRAALRCLQPQGTRHLLEVSLAPLRHGLRCLVDRLHRARPLQRNQGNRQLPDLRRLVALGEECVSAHEQPRHL